MKTKILAGLLLAGSAAFASPRIAFGIGIGVPTPVVVAPAPVVVAEPPCPGPGYVLVNGYWQLRPGWHADYRIGPVAHFEGRRDPFRR